MRLWGPNGPAEVMPALSHGWWKGWRGPKPLTADFRDRGRGFNALSVIGYRFQTLLYMNSDAKVAQDVGFYYLEARYGEPATTPGRTCWRSGTGGTSASTTTSPSW